MDISADEIVVAVPPARDPSPVRAFRTFTPDLADLVAWLRECRVDTVALESTGVYWLPIGGEGLMLIDTAAPQLITLDLRLPDVRGERVLEILQRHHAARALPVIVISAMRDIPLRVRDLAHAVVPKPFDLDELLGIIRAALPPAGAGAAATTDPTE